MNRPLKISLLTLFWLLTVIYIIWSIKEGHKAMERSVINKIEITVADSNSINIITKPMLYAWIDEAGLNPVGQFVTQINTAAINDMIKTNPFIKSVKSYVDLSGNVNVNVEQREPIFRVNSTNGYAFYFTDDNHIVPITPYASHYVPVITGDFKLPFDNTFTGDINSFIKENEKFNDKSYIFLCKLINFVRFVNNDEFWNSEIVQINIIPPAGKGKENEVEIIPRIGNNVILLGTLDNYEKKLDKLLTFYKYAKNKEEWMQGGYLNLKYKNQIVCSK